MRSLTVKLAVIAAIPLIAVSYTNCSNVGMQNYELSSEALKQSLEVGGIQINGGAAFTNSKHVTLSLVHNSADEMYVTDAEGCDSGGVWEDYAPTKLWDLKNSENKVFARYRPRKTPDFVSPCFVASIQEDVKGPVVTISRPAGTHFNSANFPFSFSITDEASGVGTIDCKADAAWPTGCSDAVKSHTLIDGVHTIRIEAVDKAGNKSSVVSDAFTIDRVAPSVTINSQPASITNSSSASMSFTGNDAVSGSNLSFLCKIDGGSFAACPGNFVQNGMGNGNHQFEVQVKDQAGNVASATYSWKVDSTVPTATILSGPSGFSQSDSAMFIYSGTDDGAALSKFDCKLDGGSYAPCLTLGASAATYTKSLTGLGQGQHTFYVIAYDAANNASAPASRIWTVDTIKPTMNPVTASVGLRTADQQVTFSFSGSDSGSGIAKYFCSMNGSAPAECSGSKLYSGLSAGTKNFSVYVKDNAGNQSSSATLSIFIDRTKPVLSVTTAPASVIKIDNPSFEFSATDADGGSITAYRCKLDAAPDFTNCVSPVVLTALAQGSHTMQIKAVDNVGNESEVYSNSFAVDSIGPAILITDQPDAIVGKNADAIIQYSVTDPDTKSLLCGFAGSTLQNCARSGTINYNTLNEGTYTFNFEAEDNLGNRSSQSITWQVKVMTKTMSQNFLVNSNSKVDVLVVVDNSGSMATEQTNMGKRFGSLLEKLAGMDWRVGIITTDVREGCNYYGQCWDYRARFQTFPGTGNAYFIDKNMNLTAAQNAFTATIQRDPGEGDGYEQGIAATHWAVLRATSTIVNDANTRAKTFFRNDANLAVIVISDADETPPGGTQSVNKPDTLINLVKSKWPSKVFSYNSIIVKDGDSACLAKDGNEGYGLTYTSLSKKTGGVIGSVCEADYGNQLAAIGQATVDQVRSGSLDCAPVGAVTVVNSNGSAVPSHTISGLKISFSGNLPAGTNTLNYNCLQ